MRSFTTSRSPVLDGIRAVAVLGVIAFHAFPSLAPGGFAGVDVFFVLSGFLITSGLLRRSGPRGLRGLAGLAGFWERRALRLLPALVLLVLLVGTVRCLSGGDAAVGFGGQVAAAFGFVTNWHLIAAGNSYFTESSPPVFQHLWSLAVEEQFYLLWPLALLLLTRITRRRRTRCAVVGVAATASAIAMMVLAILGHIGRAYYGSDTHAFGLLAGATLAIAVEGREPEPLGRLRLGAAAGVALAALLVCFRVMWGSDTGTYVVGLPSAVGLTLLLIELGRRDSGLLRRTLGARPLAAIGVRSYGLYLWHWPLLVVLRDASPAIALKHPTTLGALAIVLTAAAAAASYALVEAPIMRLGVRGYARAVWNQLHIFGPRRPWVASAAACAVAGTSIMTFSAATRAPATTALQSQIEAGQRAIAQAEFDTGPEPRTRADRPPRLPADHRDRRDAPVPRPAAHPWDHAPRGCDIDAIGDSVMLASAPALLHRFPGIAIDAVVSRQATSGPGIVAALRHAHQLRPVVLVGLGTNGVLGDGTLAAIRRAAGPDHELVFVNVFEQRPWEAGVNAQLARYVAHDPHSRVVDWHSAIAGHLAELDSDGIHPGAAGADRYAATVAATLDRLHPARPKSPAFPSLGSRRER